MAEPERFVSRVAAALGLAAIALVALVVVGIGIRVFVIVFAGVLLGVFLLALRDALCRRARLPERWSLVVVVLGLGAALGGGTLLTAPSIAEQLDDVSARLPEVGQKLQGFLAQYGWGIRLLEAAGEAGAVEEVSRRIAALAGATIGMLVFVIGLLFIGLFVALSPRLYTEGLVSLLPLGARDRAREILAEMGHMLRWFLVARAISMLFVGTATAIALSVIGVPLALLLAVVAGLFTFVPYLGPIAAGFPIGLVALVEGLDIAVVAILVYTVVQLVEGYVFSPLILQRTVHIAPAVTISAQILGGVLLGIAGVAVSTPFLAAAQVLVRRAYREGLLGEPPEARGEAPEESEEVTASPAAPPPPRTHGG
jgi:predicted PurR-regulated permease PerM